MATILIMWAPVPFLRAVESVLPDLQPMFEKYARQIDWRLLAAISWLRIALGSAGHLPTGVRGIMMLIRNTAFKVWPDRSYRRRAKPLTAACVIYSDMDE